MTEIRAIDHLDPGGLIVRSGELLARPVVEALRSGGEVTVELRGLGGVSSSYFNIFLRTVRDALGPGALGRVHVRSASPVQMQVYDRSLSALERDPVSQEP